MYLLITHFSEMTYFVLLGDWKIITSEPNAHPNYLIKESISRSIKQNSSFKCSHFCYFSHCQIFWGLSTLVTDRFLLHFFKLSRDQILILDKYSIYEISEIKNMLKQFADIYTLPALWNYIHNCKTRMFTCFLKLSTCVYF